MKGSVRFILAIVLLMLSYSIGGKAMNITSCILRATALVSCLNQLPIRILILHLRLVRWGMTDHPSLCLFLT